MELRNVLFVVDSVYRTVDPDYDISYGIGNDKFFPVRILISFSFLKKVRLDP